MTMTTTGAVIDLDALTLDGVRAGALRDRPVTVLGLARSGIALARFFADAGARVTVYDGRPAADLAEAIAALGDRPVRLVLGPDIDPASTWAHAALVATSPSINPDFPTTEPRLRGALRAMVDARAAGDPTVPALVSESDLFLRLCPVPTVGVTGTKGKTTTSSLIAAVLAADPVHPVILGGNIGSPLIDRLTELTPQHRVVDELSELQLPTLSRGTTVAVYTNVTSDHLDRHGSLEAYRAVKRRLAEMVDPRGALVLNLDDPVVASYADAGSAPVIGYTIGPAAPLAVMNGPVPSGGVAVHDDWIVADGVGPVIPLDEVPIPGPHNVSNVLAAVAVGVHFGLAPDRIRAAVASFTGVEHRLELVAVVDRVRYFNDSQGTQPDAVIAALHSFDVPVILIAGGRDKGVDMTELARHVAARAIAAVLIGESGPTLEHVFRAAGLRRTRRAESMDEAVRFADEYAREMLETDASMSKVRPEVERPPDDRRRPDSRPVVVLSPAAASFDMFVDYAARGRAFKDAVAALAAERAGGGDR
jgi:UDP-N-acetylmuramoylalanine--D-glutamate ligase